MSSLIKEHSEFYLTSERLDLVLTQLQEKLKGRVSAAYVFGSASTKQISEDSDIDLIFIKENPTEPFVKRAFEFIDLFEIFPRLDILVYSPKEFEAQLADSQIGFWKSVRESLRRIL
jgi:predicted nucleotidyltransferase